MTETFRMVKKKGVYIGSFNSCINKDLNPYLTIPASLTILLFLKIFLTLKLVFSLLRLRPFQFLGSFCPLT